ncbi:MAG: AAA family ATPase [Bacilli bacterium]|nr:AAA family ATPase [Bacilli bacterium]
MFQSVSIENFRSFAEETTIDFRANKSTAHPNTIYTNLYGKSPARITKFNMLFGPNGSGKSNLIDAISFFRFVIVRGIPDCGISDLANVFKADELGTIGKVVFHFSVPESPLLYTYTLTIDYSARTLTGEKLSSNKGDIFGWEIGEKELPIFTQLKAVFSPKADKERYKVYVDDFCSVAKPNKTFLSKLANMEKDQSTIGNIEMFFRPILEVFYRIIIFSPSPAKYKDLKDAIIDEGGKLDAMRKEIRRLGLSFNSIQLEEVDIKTFAENLGMTIKAVEEFATRIKNRINPGETRHFIRSDRPYYFGLKENGDQVFYKIVLHYENGAKLDFESESSGTQKIVNMLPVLFGEECRNNGLFLIDEVDRSLHTNLTKQFVNEIIREHGGRTNQFLFTAHDPALLDTSIFRKDELFFLENENHASHIFRLDETSIRIDRDIKKKYTSGQIKV